MQYKCGTCKKSVNSNHKAILCDICNNWVHIHCNNLTHKDYLYYQTAGTEIPWFCKNCVAETFPYSDLENCEIFALNNFKKPTNLDSLPSFDILSKLSNMPNLSDYDNEDNLINPINSKYHFSYDLNNIAANCKDYLSLLHININSLDLHFDELHSFLSDNSIPFHIVAISETREKSGVGFRCNNRMVLLYTLNKQNLLQEVWLCT